VGKAEAAGPATFHKHLLKIESIRNRRLHDPRDPATIPAAFEVQHLKQKREIQLTNELSNLMDHVRLKSEAMGRLERRMHDPGQKEPQP
jgi:hypothetical protein